MPLLASPPPVFTNTLMVRGVFFSSYPKWLIVLSCAPQNLLGQWHCSHVCAAGRRFFTGEGIGRGNVLKVAAYTCRKPDIFDFTYHEAPDPTWHSTQATRACGDC